MYSFFSFENYKVVGTQTFLKCFSYSSHILNFLINTIYVFFIHHKPHESPLIVLLIKNCNYMCPNRLQLYNKSVLKLEYSN